MATDDEKAKKCLRWIKDEEHMHRCSGYGENKKSVQDALDSQKDRIDNMEEYERKVNALPRPAKEKVIPQYNGLLTMASKRLHCIEDISKIAELEDLLVNLSVAVSSTASDLVDEDAEEKKENASDDPEVIPEGAAAAAQNCILAVKKNWSWLTKLIHCNEIHLNNAANYHKFFHDAVEYKDWMPASLQKATKKVKLHPNPERTGDRGDSRRMLNDLKELLTLFSHWQQKLEELLERSKHILPVPLRTTKLDHDKPVSSLVDYKTEEIDIREGEELVLMDNGDHTSWKVRNLNDEESDVPSVICLIPGPDPRAMQAAMRLRLQLLGHWTQNIKRIGKELILFLILCLRDWNDDDIKMLKAMPDNDKKRTLEALDFVEKALAPNWKEWKGYAEMESRIDDLRKILSQRGNARDRDDGFTADLLDRAETSQNLVKNYDDLWRLWQAYKILVETSKYDDYLLIADEWEKLKFIDKEELRKLWQSRLMFSDGENEDFDSWLKRWQELWGQEVVDEVVEDMIQPESAMAETSSSGEVMETAQTDQISSAKQEEKKTFVITGVVNPENDQVVSMQEAVNLGIINSAEGTYVNKITGHVVPIPVAMNAGKIQVSFTKTKRSKEERVDVGLITIRTKKESRPYTVTGVIDAKTDRKLSVREATRAGIFDQDNNVYKNTYNHTTMTLADALDSGLLVVEFDTNARITRSETITKTYAIRGVVDQRAKVKVKFSDAVRKGLLNKETGAYYHNILREYVYVGDAIKRGFIKAHVVTDPNMLDISPDNQMVVEKVEDIRKKVLGPMKAMAALKRAAAAN